MATGPDITKRIGAFDALAWRVLRNATIRARAHPRVPTDVNQEEGDELVAPFQQQLLVDVNMLREALKQMYLLGVESVHAMLQGQDGVDQEMLEQVIEFHANPQDTDAAELEEFVSG